MFAGSELILVATLGLTSPASPEASTTATPKIPVTTLADAAGRARFDQQNATDWQREYEQALDRKSSGKKKMLIGAAATVGGALFAGMAARECDVDDFIDGNGCDDELDLAWLGYLTSVAGGGMLIWGGIEFFDANGDLNRLEQRRPTSSSASIPLTRHLELLVGGGARKSLSASVSW
jgi:hypothetical protein